MKNPVYFVFILFLGVSLSSNIYSQEKEKKETKKETMKETMKETAKEKIKDSEDKIVNSICPVTGEDADEEITYKYNGKTYALCCNKCLKKFKADPEKYISRLSDDGKSLKKK